MIQVRFRKLFVGGLDPSITEEDLRSHFSKFGTLTGCTVHRDLETGRSRGFGFITFDDIRSVDAVQNSRPHHIKGCEVTLKRAVPKECFQEFDGLLTVNRLFVGGLKPEMDERILKEHFSAFGRVRRIELMVDRRTNTPRGFGFVEFDDYDPVDKVVLRGTTHNIIGHDVTVGKAKSRLEMELMRHRSGVPGFGLAPPQLRRWSTPFSQVAPPYSAFLGRASLDSLDCPFHTEGRRRARFF